MEKILSKMGVKKTEFGYTVGGYLDLRGTSITALPDNLTVGGYLDLSGTSITALPDKLSKRINSRRILVMKTK